MDLHSLGARFALVGGLAIGARVEPRYTRDVDLAIAVSHDDEAESIVHGLSRRGYAVVTIIEQSRTGRMATARLTHPSMPGIFVDLLFASSGIEEEVVAGADPIAYGAGRAPLPVASIGHLIALKVLSESERRLQDRIDLQLLATAARREDWKAAEAASRLIRSRGFHRGRALVRRLRRWRPR